MNELTTFSGTLQEVRVSQKGQSISFTRSLLEAKAPEGRQKTTEVPMTARPCV